MIKITVGCSGSGKSTWAHNQWLNSPDKIVVVNRDKIREMLFSYTENSVSEYYSRTDLRSLEKQVSKYEDSLIYEALNENKTVIVDATHLEQKYVKRFEYWNVPLELVWFDTPLELCFARDKERTRKVGEEVINKQFLKYASLRKNFTNYSFTPKVVDNVGKESCYVFDIDGCLADNTNIRSPFEWNRVIEDKPIKAMIKLLHDINASNEWKMFNPIYICSGRDEVCAEITKDWFRMHFGDVSNFKFMFRPKEDVRPDWIVKQEMVFEINKTHSISIWFDDRLQVTRHLRMLGIKVLNVEHNNF